MNYGGLLVSVYPDKRALAQSIQDCVRACVYGRACLREGEKETESQD